MTQVSTITYNFPSLRMIQNKTPKTHLSYNETYVWRVQVSEIATGWQNADSRRWS